MNIYEIYDMNGKLIKTVNADNIYWKNDHCFLVKEKDCTKELVAVIGINNTVIKKNEYEYKTKRNTTNQSNQTKG